MARNRNNESGRPSHENDRQFENDWSNQRGDDRMMDYDMDDFDSGSNYRGESNQQMRNGEGRFRNQGNQGSQWNQGNQNFDRDMNRGMGGSRGGGWGQDRAINQGEQDFSRGMGNQRGGFGQNQGNNWSQGTRGYQGMQGGYQDDYDQSNYGGQGRFRGQQESGSWRGQGQGYQGGRGSQGMQGDYDSSGSGYNNYNNMGSGSQGQHYGRGPQGYRRSDERIQEEVNERLMWHGDVDATNIQVTVSNGEVTLEGTVTDRTQKRLAEEALENMRGVGDIHNRLRVQGQNNQSSGSSGSSSFGSSGSSDTGTNESNTSSMRETTSNGTRGSRSRSNS